MIIVNLTGGLGNQMFQYAFGRYIALENKTELKYHFTNALFNTKRNYELDIFSFKLKEADDQDLKKMGIFQNRLLNRFMNLTSERFGLFNNKYTVTEKYPYKFNKKYLNIKNPAYIQGYWADTKYFESVSNVIRKNFILKKQLDDNNKKIINNMKKEDSISLHIRRGDYITNNANKFLYTGLEYYEKSIKSIQNKILHPVFYIFSDDIYWCRQNFKKLDRVKFIDHNRGINSYKDMILMSNCKHNIIAKSTFSWWAAWLNTNKEKIIIRPY